MDRRLLSRLHAILDPADVLAGRVERLLYDGDSQRLARRTPEVVLLPRSAEQTAAVVRLAREMGVPLTARGAGTGLSGGAVPAQGSWVVSFTRMRRILSLDPAARQAWVEPGLVNRELQEAAAPHGLRFAPDPSSQTVSTLGGNLAENAGGPHCFRSGVTTQHLLGLEIVDDAGEIHHLGGDWPGGDPLDAVGLLAGSEGTLALVTAMGLRLVPLPEAVATLLAPFAGLEAACAAVSELLEAGLRPAAVEILDAEAIRAVEASVFHAGWPENAEAVVLLELEGPPAAVAAGRRTLREHLGGHGALRVEEAESPETRLLLWRGRKGAFGALGRLYRDISVQDICVPISRLPEAVRRVVEIVRAQDLPVANTFHAGDGNLHPNIGYDRDDPDQRRRLHLATEGIMRLAVELGGTLSGEHGIGLEKSAWLPLALSAADRHPQLALKAALDPQGRFNPGKIFPAADAPAPGRFLHVLEGPARPTAEEDPRFHRPGREGELAELLADEAGRGRLLLASGARLREELPELPGPVHDIVSLASLQGILEHARADFTVTVRAGTPWSELQAALAEAGQELDWEVSFPDRRSVGGVVASDESWPFRAGQRSPRDRLLGLAGLLAHGEAFRAGGRVVKNVTGYDLPRLLAGSRGALAVLTRLTLRTRPLPEVRRLLLLAYTDREAAQAAAFRVYAELDDPAGVILAPPGLDLPGLPRAWRVGLRLEGDAVTVDAADRGARDRLSRAGLAPAEVAAEEDRAGPWLETLRDFPRPPRPGQPRVLRELRAGPRRLLDCLPYLGERWVLDLAGLRLRLAGEDGDWLSPGPLTGGRALERCAVLNTQGAEGPSRFRGLAGRPWLERVLHAMDPEGRLAPGRWLLG
ncbi:MAG: FAD-binding protein [Candidatus Krumholzibacteriota bacterium]|nr:FAD-binding protein [Candidatus Krumholzibacteriota bacterium]